MLLLGFGNKARNGKDTAAEAIVSHYKSKNDLERLHGMLRGPGTRIGIFKYANALYAEVNEFLQHYPLTKVSGLWLPTSGSIEWPRPERFKIGNEWTEGTSLFNAEWYPLGTKMIQIPEWVQLDPNPQISSLAPFGKHPKLLQWWGTEYRRNLFGEDYWVKKLFATIPANLDIAMITDVRFIDEADAIKQRGGYTINVQRLREDGTQYYSDDRPADHPSETQLDGYNWDFYLKIPHGHAALTGELAITLAEYLKGLK